MVFPSPFHNDALFNCFSIVDHNTTSSSFSIDSNNYPEPLLPPSQSSLHNHHHHHHHNNGSSFADTSLNSFPSLLSADIIVDDLSIPVVDVAELEWHSEFLYNCYNFSVTGEKMAKDPSVMQSDASFASKADHKGLKAVGGKSRPKTENGGSSSSLKEVPKKPRCTHCAADYTPQWRSGPLGPKTLCNACGVRYKSGRLVPEYRPASSPTFVMSQHSNSHRKVLELRRRKELMVIKQEAPLK